MQPRLNVKVLPLESQVLLRSAVLVLFHPVLGQGIAHAYRLQHGGMVNAGRSAPGLVAGGPDDMAICVVVQFPGGAQVVRMHVQGLALQRLGGASCGTTPFRRDCSLRCSGRTLVFQTLSSLLASCRACCTKGLPRALSRAS